uniref:Uncharacterized protein n=1 Tax=Manihot esculenta TaxID=3983 RepID=A0A2C9W2J1_MANES
MKEMNFESSETHGAICGVKMVLEGLGRSIFKRVWYLKVSLYINY